jgi:hypothetical protein
MALVSPLIQCLFKKRFYDITSMATFWRVVKNQI